MARLLQKRGSNAVRSPPTDQFSLQSLILPALPHQYAPRLVYVNEASGWMHDCTEDQI
jgi:hypothetical protein